MKTFRQFVKTNRIAQSRLLSDTSRSAAVYAWITELKEQLKNTIDLFPTWSKCASFQLLKWLNGHLKNWNKENIATKINELDHVINLNLLSLRRHAISKSRINPIPPTLQFPFDPKTSGVSMTAYIVFDKDSKKVVLQSTSHDVLQTKKIGGDIKKYIDDIKAALERSKLNKAAHDLVIHRLKQPHAEDHWFAAHLPALIDYLEENKDKFPALNGDANNYWPNHIAKYPRIEFVMTSSPCFDCHQLFQDLRGQITRLGLAIPIVIFANTPYLKHEIPIGSPVNIVDYNGNYVSTCLSADLPHYRKQMMAHHKNDIRLYLMGSEEQAYAQLERITSKHMASLLTAPPALQRHLHTELFNFFQHLSCGAAVNWVTYCWIADWLSRLPEGFAERTNLPKEWGLALYGRGMPYEYVQARYSDSRRMWKIPLTEQPQTTLNQCVQAMFDRLLKLRPEHSPYIAWDPAFGDEPDTHPLSFTQPANSVLQMSDDELMANAREVCQNELGTLKWASEMDFRPLDADEQTRYMFLENHFEAAVLIEYEKTKKATADEGESDESRPDNPLKPS